MTIVYCDCCKTKFDGHKVIPVVSFTMNGTTYEFCHKCLDHMITYLVTNPQNHKKPAKEPAKKKTTKKKASKKTKALAKGIENE